MPITWPKVGAAELISLRGSFAPLGEEVQDITRPNVHGLALRKRGKRSMPVRMPFVAGAASAANADILKTNLLSLKGSLQTVIEESGLTYTNIAVTNVEIFSTRVVVSSSGGTPEAPTHLVSGAFEFMYTETS